MADGLLPADNDDHIKNMQNPEANSYCPNRNPVIKFAGYDWWTNYHWSQGQGTYVWEPFKSVFDPKVIQQDADGITLWIKPPENGQEVWKTSELVLVPKLGYGMYVVTARMNGGSFSDLDPNAVFGIFTYQFSEAPAGHGANKHREIDALEVLRGGSSNAQFTLQPFGDSPPHPWSPFMIPPNTPVITSVMLWNEEQNGVITVAHMYLFAGDHDVNNLPPWDSAIHNWKSEGFSSLIPRHTATSCERLHINLWLMHGVAPAAEQSVKITRFQFKPLPSAAAQRS
jgi:hypothetical protein